MEKLTEVLAMEGFGVYVWPSFLLTMIVMGFMLFSARRALKRAQSGLSALQSPVADEA